MEQGDNTEGERESLVGGSLSKRKLCSRLQTV